MKVIAVESEQASPPLASLARLLNVPYGARAIDPQIHRGRRPISGDLSARWKDYLDRIDAPAIARSQVAALTQGGKAVLTGQQPGLFLGPSLTVLKAARAISLAHTLTQATRIQHVPVFWIASDDHDIGEINHTFVVHQEGEVRRLRAPVASLRSAACNLKSPAEGESLAKLLFEWPGVEAFEHARALAPRPGDSWSQWFARCLLHLFGKHGLVPIEPEVLGRGAEPVFEKALRRPQECQSAIEQGAAALEIHGSEAPLKRRDDSLVFLIDQDRRQAFRRDGDRWSAGDRSDFLEGWMRLLQGPGPRLSGNVALRTILQAAALPVVAYVAGPNEALYYLQLKPLHDYFEVDFPLLEPRPCATLLGKRAVRAMRKLNLKPSDLGLLAREDQASPATAPVLERGAQLLETVRQYLRELASTGRAMPSIARPARQLEHSFGEVLERAGRSLQLADEGDAKRRRLLQRFVHPRGKPQDRVLNFLPFLAELGEPLLETILTLEGQEGRQWLVFPSSEEP